MAGLYRALRFAFLITFATLSGSALWTSETDAGVAGPLPVVELSLEWEGASNNGDGTYANLFAVTLTNASPVVLWGLDLTLIDAKPHIDLSAGSRLGVDVIGPGETLALTWQVDSPVRLTPRLADHLVTIFAGEADDATGARRKIDVRSAGGR